MNRILAQLMLALSLVVAVAIPSQAQRVFNGYTIFVPTTRPTTPDEGTVYQSQTDHKFYIYSGSAWVAVGSVTDLNPTVTTLTATTGISVGATDTTISRVSASVLGVGTGASGNADGAVKAASFLTSISSGGLTFDGTGTRLKGPDGGQYLIELNGGVLVNAASLQMANGGTKFIFASPSVDGQQVITDSTGTKGVGLDVTTDGTLKVRSRAFGAATVDVSAITGMTTPLTVAQGGTQLATLTAHALYVGNTTSAPTALAVGGTGTYLRGAVGADPGWSTVTLPNTVATGNVLIASATNVVSALTPGSLVSTFPANQTGNATATLKMNGLGAAAAPCVITPNSSGRVMFNISGQIVQNTSADGIAWKMTYGTGTPPANAAAASGTALSALQTHTALTGALEESFSLTGTATGLSLVATWFDLQVADVTGGTASITNVTCSALEF